MAIPPADEDLKCAACGEVNPPQFEMCWNCGHDLRDAQRIAADELQTDIADRSSTTPLRKNGTVVWADWLEPLSVFLASCAYPILWRAFYGRNESQPETAVSVLISVPVYAGWLILLWLLVRRDGRTGQPAPLRFRGWYWEALFGVLIAAGAWIVSIMTAVLAVDLRLPKAEPQVYVQITNFKLAAIYGVLWGFAAAYEEVLFRVYLQSKLELLLGETILSILISAFLFAASHGYPPRGAMHVFMFGVLFGSIYRLSPRLPRLVIAHWIWDFVRALGR